MRRRFVQIDGQLHEVPLDWRPDPVAEHHVMPDIKPYRSMVDGSMIGSRSMHREHLKAHGCIEVGNEMPHMMKKVRPMQSPPGLKERIVSVANEKLRRR